MILSCRFSSLIFNSLIAVIYAPWYEKEQQCLWESITHGLSNLAEHVLIMGDFNQVLDRSQRSSGNASSSGVRFFKKMVDDLLWLI